MMGSIVSSAERSLAGLRCVRRFTSGISSINRFGKDAALLALISGVFAAGTCALGQASEKADGALFAAKLSVAGVKPGMTKAQAEAAIKAFNPALVAVEMYSASNAGFIYHRPKFQFRPASAAFFTELAVMPRSRLKHGSGPLTQSDLESGWTFAKDGHPDCGGDLVRTAHTPDSVTYHVLFTADLQDPRVALIEEEHAYCARSLTVQAVIGKLYENWGKTPAIRQSIREDGVRITPDLLPGAGQVAFLEWRYTSPMTRRQSLNPNDSMVNAASGLFDGFGNRDGGIAAHAEIIPTQDLAYMDRVNTALWDDAAMVNYYGKIGWVLSEMDRVGITIGGVGDKSLLAKVQPYRDPNAPPVAPKGAPQFDAYLTLGMLFPRMAKGGLTLPKGMGLYRVTDLDEMDKRSTFAEPRTWFTIDPAVCAAHPDYKCERPIAFKNTDWKPIVGGQPSVAAQRR
jgi:hypothetical protein